MIRPSWDEYFMLLAKMLTTRSTCLSRPTGAVIVRDRDILSTGYNGSMPSAPHCSDEGACQRRHLGAPEGDKYNFCRSIHAEANAVARAAKRGVSLEGSVCYCTLAPCYVCLKMLASAGIRRIVYELDYESPDTERDAYWREAIKDSPIVSVDRLIVPTEALSMVCERLAHPTSRRRI